MIIKDYIKKGKPEEEETEVGGDDEEIWDEEI